MPAIGKKASHKATKQLTSKELKKSPSRSSQRRGNSGTKAKGEHDETDYEASQAAPSFKSQTQ